MAAIGKGAQARVYLGWDSRLRFWRAVKVLAAAYLEDLPVRARFDGEAQMMARFSHRNVMPVVDVDAHGNIPYMVMDLARGGSLVDWMRRNGPMPGRMAVGVAISCCDALEYTHARGVVHRDVKPHNILIHEDGRAILTDFGIARADDAVQLTANGAAMGTFAFMPPEQRADAHSVTERADVYALGATLYTVLTAKTSTELFLADSRDSMLDGVPEPVRPVLLKACKYEPELRYASITEMRVALQEALAQLPEDRESPPLYQETIRLPAEVPSVVGPGAGLDDLVRLLTPSDPGASASAPPTGTSSPGAGTGKTDPGARSGKTDPGARSGKTDPGVRSGKTDPGVRGGKTNPGELPVLPYSMPAVKRGARSAAPASGGEGEELPEYLRAPAQPPGDREPATAGAEAAPTAPPTDVEPVGGATAGPPTAYLGRVAAVLLVGALLFGGTAYWSVHTKSAATAARSAASHALVAQLTGMEAVVDQLGQLGADRNALQDAFFAFHDARKGSDQARAAHEVAVLVVAEAERLGPQERGQPQIVELRKRPREADEAEARWEAARTSLIGRVTGSAGTR